MDFHQNSDSYFGGGMNVLAQTEFYSSGGSQVNPYSTDWYYTEIHINDDMYSQPYITNKMALGTTIHEMGHAFGLDHYNSNPNSIMCQTSYGRVAQKVKKTDNDAINTLY